MALTKIGSIGINTGIAFAGVTTIATLNASDNVLSVGGTVNFVSDVSIGGTVSIAGTLTYEDVTNVDAVGLITARDGIVVGSGITLSVDGDGFFTGVVTATTFSGAFSGDGSALTGVANTDVIFPDKISLGDGSQTDGDQINIGIGSDLRIYHNGSHNYLDSVNGNIYLRVNSTENAIKCTENGNVEIAYDGSKKIETDSSGVTVTGRVAATSYTGDGSALTGIEVGMSTASAQVSGITTVVDLSKDDIRLDCTGLVTIDTKGGSEGSSHSLRIVNVGLATVSFNSYFKFPSGGAPILPTASGAISLISFTVHTQGRVGVASVFLAGSSVNFS
jgi:hypothetical protein